MKREGTATAGDNIYSMSTNPFGISTVNITASFKSRELLYKIIKKP